MISNRQAAFSVLRKMPPGHEFTGAELARQVKELTNKQAYISTSLRNMREYRELYGVDIVNVDKAKSIYKIVG